MCRNGSPAGSGHVLLHQSPVGRSACEVSRAHGDGDARHRVDHVGTYKVTRPPARPLPELRTHAGFEWLYVLSGRLRLRVGERDLVLTRDEAAEFDTGTPHAISADGARPAQVISIFNDDGARIHTHLSAPVAEA